MSGENWDILEQRCRSCTSCGLAATRTNVVFGAGCRQAEVMLVGEGPGENEDRQGEPFVGRGAASEKARQRASAALRNFFILSSSNVSNFPYTKLPTKPLIGIESILTRKMHKIQYTIFTYFSLLKRSIV